MGDKKQLEILNNGAPSWNTWRASNRNAVIDLTDEDLSGMELSTVNLGAAQLQRADLSRSNLTAANLSAAGLNGADLTEAILCGAFLHWADFGDANLSGANLTSAELSGAYFRDSLLVAAELTSCLMHWTTFASVDLSSVKGLDSVRHVGPSTIGIDTIYISNGNTSENFLRDAGVPVEFITYMRSLTANPIEYYSCFISYSNRDEELAKRLHCDLQAEHVRCWFAPEDLKIGDRFRPRIDEAIRLYDKLLLLLSKHSVQSRWVETEVEAAFEKESTQDRTVLFPIRLDDTIMQTDKAWAAQIRRARHIGDFANWKSHDSYKKAFERLLRDLQAGAKSKPALNTRQA